MRTRTGAERGALARSLSLLLVFAALAVPSVAASDGPVDTAEDRFLPSLAGVVGLDVQYVEASVDSAARGAFAGDDRIVFPSPGAELELMSPALLPGGPRLFVQGGAALALDQRRNTLKEGTPSAPIIPFIDANRDGIPDENPTQDAPASGARGVGSAVRSKVKGPVWRAGAGVAFTTAFGSRNVWIKPSLVYQRQETEITTIVSAVESIEDDAECPCRDGIVKRTDTEPSDMLGGGLEVEVDAARTGDFLVTLSLSGRAYHLLGDRTVDTTVMGAFSDGKPMPVQSRFERDPWSYAGSIGIRVRWLPLSGLPE